MHPLNGYEVVFGKYYNTEKFLTILIIYDVSLSLLFLLIPSCVRHNSIFIQTQKNKL